MAVDAGQKYASVSIDVGIDHTPLGDDEPVFTLRGKDQFAVPAIQCYRELCLVGDSPPEHLAAIDRALGAIESWQQTNPESVKTPD